MDNLYYLPLILLLLIFSFTDGEKIKSNTSKIETLESRVDSLLEVQDALVRRLEGELPTDSR